MKKIPYFRQIRGYTIQLVIEAIKTMGPPTNIAKVENENIRGPLLVTLAEELARVLEALITDSLTHGRGIELEGFLEFLGGEKFQNAKKMIEQLSLDQDRLMNAAIELEKMFVNYGEAEYADHNKDDSRHIACIYGGYLKVTSPSMFESDFERYSGQVKKYKLNLKMLNILNKHLEDDVKRIISSPGFYEKYNLYLKKRGIESVEHVDNLCQKGIAVNFSSNHHLLFGGSPMLLSKNDPAWWRQFSCKISQKVKKMANASSIDLMMRDPLLGEYADTLTNNDTSNAWNSAISTPMEQQDSRYYKRYNGSRDLVNIRKRLSLQKKQDEMVKKWMFDNGGVFHPCNKFTRNLKLFGLTKDRFTILFEAYPVERAMNELYWRLSGESLQAFTPYVSNSYPVEKWEVWVRDAKVENPKYWERQVK